MKLLSRQTMRGAATVAVAMGAGLAQAHTGHDTLSLWHVLAHLFTVENMLAAAAMGLVLGGVAWRRRARANRP